DMTYTVPFQDIARLEKAQGVKVGRDTEIRTMFMHLDQARDELLESTVKGKNPFKDLKVRQAIYQAIDTDALVARAMRGEAAPPARLWGPGVNGWTADVDKRPLPFDPEAAKKLLAAAGYPEGFGFTLDCPNDRYANDEATCQAIVGMLARVGIKANLR